MSLRRFTGVRNASQEEFQVFLAARDPSSAATALHAMRQLWKVLEELPLYNKLLAGDNRMSALIPLSARTPGYSG